MVFTLVSVSVSVFLSNFSNIQYLTGRAYLTLTVALKSLTKKVFEKKILRF